MRLIPKPGVAQAAAMALAEAEKSGKKVTGLVVHGYKSEPEPEADLDRITGRQVTTINPTLPDSVDVDVTVAREALQSLGSRGVIAASLDRLLNAVDSFNQRQADRIPVEKLGGSNPKNLRRRALEVGKSMVSHQARFIQKLKVEVTFEDGEKREVLVGLEDRARSIRVNVRVAAMSLCAGTIPIFGRGFHIKGIGDSDAMAMISDAKGLPADRDAYQAIARRRRAQLTSSFIPFGCYALGALAFAQDLGQIVHAGVAPSVFLVTEARAPK